MQRNIAIQGGRGSFHEEAAIRYFGKHFITNECTDFQQLIGRVESKNADYGVMAIENSLVGSILKNFSMLRDSSLQITGEVYMRISLNLLALSGQTINDLKEVQSHPMALLQSEEFFMQYPTIRLIETNDTAESAKEIASDQLRGVGAIGSVDVAGMYGLSIIARDIETHKENYTRFLVVSPRPEIPDKNQKVKASVAFTAPHQPGSLSEILQPLAEAGVNLSMLQSLPLPGKKWEYIFHMDMIFSNSENAMKIINALGSKLKNVWIMGIYPIANNT